MTIAEALIFDLNNLVGDVEKLLTDQELSGSDEYTIEIRVSKDYQLAFANGLLKIILSPNWSQGDMSESWGDRNSIEKMIARIFNKFDPENNPFPNAISTITDMSEIW